MKQQAILAAMASAFLIAGPALAANSGQSAASSAQQVVTHATRAIDQMKSNQQLDWLLLRAKGVFILPNEVKGAVIVGGQGGEGVLLARKAYGWSDPAFLTLASGSVGAQVGGQSGPVVMLLMTQKAVNDYTRSGNFSLNANAGLTVVNYSAKGQASVGKSDVIVWSGASGGFVGANVSGTQISADSKQVQAYYGRKVTTRQIIGGQVTNRQAEGLRNALPG